MALDNFSWKSLFVNEEENSEKKTEQSLPKQVTSNNKFPENTTSFPTPIAQNNTQNVNTITTNNNQNNPFLNDVLAVYEKGFESLNQSGFDFFEMYKSVLAVGPTNPQSYQMAFTMGKTINPELSKPFLLEKAKFYTDEIQKVYEKYNITGFARKKELNDSINSDKAALTKTIADLESQIAKLQSELQKNKEQFDKIDASNISQFNEFQQKIDANNMAKDTILQSINTVITGINQYL